MDCRTCEPTLIDLVYSELATDAAREAHAHLAQCTSCRTSFERLVSAKRLAADLPLVEPPAGIEDRVLQMAEEHARATIARKSVATTKPSAWRRLLDLIGVLVSRPQFAMGAVMVLMVAVGLISLPRLRHEPAATGTTVIDPDPEGEATPSTGVAPAQPLDLKVDLRARRIRSKDEPPVPAAAAAPAAVAEEQAPAELARRDQPVDDPLSALDDVLDLTPKREAPATATTSATARASAKKGADEGLASGERDAYAQASSGLKRKSAASPSDFADKLGASAAPEAFPGSVGSGSGRAGGTLGELRERKQSASAASKPSVETTSADADGRYNSRAESEAAPAPPAAAAPASAPAKPSPEPVSAPAKSAANSGPSGNASLLADARSIAREHGCTAALPTYERVVSAEPSSTNAGLALVEMAQCRRSAGDPVGARALLQRATRIPAVATRARTLLDAAP